jgi:hypothetical protein
MNFEKADRLPTIEWAGWWDLTLERWREEGLPAHLTDPGEIREYLGLDCYRQYGIHHRAQSCPAAKYHGGPLIATEKDYEEFKVHLFPEEVFHEDIVRDWGRRQAEGEMVVWITLEGFFWFPRTLLGIEPHMYAFFDKPELMHRINADLAEFHLRALDQFCGICTPQFMTFAEDMSYNNGPMLSRSCFEEFIAPYYRKVVPALEERGILPIVDSDGDVSMAIPWFEDVGVAGILPLERMAGVDVAKMRENHPRFRMIGAFDKMVMKHGEEAMRKEFERLLPTMRTGGFIPSVDHQTPPDVSLENYRVYVRLLKEYCGKCSVNPFVVRP